MSGSLRLAVSHAWAHPGRTSLLVLCVGVTAALPMLASVLAKEFQTSLLSRARSTPLLAGPPGSRFDLVLSALYFRPATEGVITMREFDRLVAQCPNGAVPIHARYTARGWPLVATSHDYFGLRGLVAARGRLPAVTGEAVLGAEAGGQLGLGPGDWLFSDPRGLLDITRPPALRMRVTGVLARTGTPDDGAIFTDISTAWVLDGLAHAHAEAGAMPEALVLERTRDSVALSEEMVEYNELTPERLSSIHLHAGREQQPLTAVMLAPETAKQATLLKNAANRGTTLSVIVPEEAVGEVIRHVARLGRFVRGLSVALGVLTAALVSLVFTLSVRVRSREFETLLRIGASRGMMAGMVAWEVLVVAAGGGVLALIATAAVRLLSPDLVKLL